MAEEPAGLPAAVSSKETFELVPLDAITVPRDRVTSVMDGPLAEELEESIRSQGVLEPISLMRIGEELWLVDGLHRIQIAEQLGIKELRAVIKDGTPQDLVIENIVRSRQRGRSNPAQEAEMLLFLTAKQNWPLEAACKRMGLSESWAKKLLVIAQLPEEIKDHIKHQRLSVSGAFHLAVLHDSTQQLQVAEDAVRWKYTAEQVKARVVTLLTEGFTPEPGDTTFSPEGAPSRVPLRCWGCNQELPKDAKYAWMCQSCLEIGGEFFRRYHAPEPPAAPPTQPSTESVPPKTP